MQPLFENLPALSFLLQRIVSGSGIVGAESKNLPMNMSRSFNPNHSSPHSAKVHRTATDSGIETDDNQILDIGPMAQFRCVRTS